MTVQEQHIDFKRKINKIDTATYTNFEVPFIDEYLNEGMEIFIKRRIQMNNIYSTGFEGIQKRIEDLKELVNRNPDLSPNISFVKVEDKLFKAELPVDYLYHIRSRVAAKKGGCSRDMNCIISQHDDLNNVLDSQFYSPSFEWGEVPTLFSGNEIYVYSDGTFDALELKLDYIRRPKRIANPDAYIDEFNNSGYLLPVKDSSGNYIPAVQQDCELQSMYACREIVDIAVELAHMDLGDPKFQISSYKNKIYNE